MKRIGSALISYTVRALAQSMSPHVMVDLARKFIPGYDLYARTGFPSSIAIPNKDAARQIVTDLQKSGHYLDFILLLVEVGEKGHMGRKYAIPYMREILGGIFDMDLIYDQVTPRSPSAIRSSGGQTALARSRSIRWPLRS